MPRNKLFWPQLERAPLGDFKRVAALAVPRAPMAPWGEVDAAISALRIAEEHLQRAYRVGINPEAKSNRFPSRTERRWMQLRQLREDVEGLRSLLEM